MIPPSMHRGMVTKAQMTRMTTMVPKGKACVDCSNRRDQLRVEYSRFGVRIEGF